MAGELQDKEKDALISLLKSAAKATRLRASLLMYTELKQVSVTSSPGRRTDGTLCRGFRVLMLRDCMLGSVWTERFQASIPRTDDRVPLDDPDLSGEREDGFYDL